MNDEPIGKGATTLDWLRSQYPWLAELLDRKDNALRKIAALRDSEADEPLDDAIAIAERALAQSATPAPAAPDARVDDTLSKLRSAINDLRNYDQIGAVSRQYFAYYLELWLDAALPPSPAPLPAMTLEKRANEIAELANTCCDRSDGYEKDVYALALEHLREVSALRAAAKKEDGR